jgi:hypothetical protein
VNQIVIESFHGQIVGAGDEPGMLNSGEWQAA